MSAVLSLLGLGQDRTHHGAQQRAEANRLVSALEGALQKAAERLKVEALHLEHRLRALTGEERLLDDQFERVLDGLWSELDAGLKMVEDNRRTIAAASSWAPSRQWEEVITILHRQHAAADLQLERTRLNIGQLHRILDNAENELRAELLRSEEKGWVSD